MYDAFGDLKEFGDTTITYDAQNAPVTVPDGSSTVEYSRLVDYSIIEKSTTTTSGNSTVRYSHDGLILATDGAALTQVVAIGPVTVTIPVTTGTAGDQLDTMSGHRLLALDSAGASTSSKPVLFDPYGAQIQPTQATEPTLVVPDYGWNGGRRVESETIDPSYVMMGARVYPINSIDPDGMESKVWRAFANWWKHNFADFWKDDIPKPWNWLVGSDAPAWRKVVVIVIVIVVVVILIVAATDGAGDELILDVTEDSSSTFSGGVDRGSLDISATNVGYDAEFDGGLDGDLDVDDVRPSVYQNGRIVSVLDDPDNDQLGTIVEENSQSRSSVGLVR